MCRDERELNEIQKAGNISMGFGLALCFVIHFLRLMFKNEMDVISYACFTIFGGMSLVYSSLLLARLKKNRRGFPSLHMEMVK